MKNFFTEGIFGIRYGKRGWFSRPSLIEFNWRLGDTEKKDAKDCIHSKMDSEDLKFDIKVKI